jgi:hypothetical protein
VRVAVCRLIHEAFVRSTVDDMMANVELLYAFEDGKQEQDGGMAQWQKKNQQAKAIGRMVDVRP